ncbi:hypothetical protein DAPPUDRAFT_240372 [Daphnia pulex]|uniref:Uncharacterized protein n=1 Tax=Daphnia pulex TaxID=6669 RepID=E9GBF3_DAPPU|nr:hypothetical protein DAPPUDRAFT_240372 [Daphnia pulex]|eukprot:EFX83165.1 hypothetical protein DAPPUDRAFT_240372 [Daphnia pulex]
MSNNAGIPFSNGMLINGDSTNNPSFQTSPSGISTMPANPTTGNTNLLPAIIPNISLTNCNVYVSNCSNTISEQARTSQTDNRDNTGREPAQVSRGPNGVENYPVSRPTENRWPFQSDLLSDVNRPSHHNRPTHQQPEGNESHQHHHSGREPAGMIPVVHNYYLGTVINITPNTRSPNTNSQTKTCETPRSRPSAHCVPKSVSWEIPFRDHSPPENDMKDPEPEYPGPDTPRDPADEAHPHMENPTPSTNDPDDAAAAPSDDPDQNQQTNPPEPSTPTIPPENDNPDLGRNEDPDDAAAVPADDPWDQTNPPEPDLQPFEEKAGPAEAKPGDVDVPEAIPIVSPDDEINTPNQNVSKSKKGFGASLWTSITRPFTKTPNKKNPQTTERPMA